MRKSILIISFIIFWFGCSGQKAIKDTIVDSITYSYAYYSSNGKLKALSQNKKDEGEWVFFNKMGVKIKSGAYNTNGKKNGRWYYYGREEQIHGGIKVVGTEFIDYDNGREITKGFEYIDDLEFK